MMFFSARAIGPRLRSALVLWAGLLAAGPISAPAQEHAPAVSSDAAVRQYRDAAALHNRQVYDLAADEWNKFLKQFPADPLAPKARRYLGVCYLQLKKYDEARATFEALIAAAPQFDELEAALLDLGLANFSLGQAGQSGAYDRAISTFDRLITQFPNGTNVPQALYYRGEALDAVGKKQPAIQSWSQLVEKYPKDPRRADALYALGVTQEEAGQAAEAGKSYDLFLKDYPEHASAAEVGLRKAETLLATDHLTEAEQRLKAAAAAGGPLADRATVRWAATLFQQQKFAEAATVYASVPQKFADSPEVNKALLNAGLCFERAGKSDEARDWLARAQKTGGETGAEAAHWLARSWLKEHKAAEALRVVEGALPAADKTASLPNLLLDQADAVYELPERRGEAAKLYAALAQKYPQDPLAPQALYLAAYTAMGQTDYPAALKYADAFLKLSGAAKHEMAPDVKFVQAECLLQQSRPADAATVLGDLIETFPQHVDVDKWRVRQAVALQRQQKPADVVAYVAAAIKKVKSPDAAAELQYLAGLSQLELHEPRRAITAFEAALAAQPKWREADETRLALAQVQLSVQDYAGGEKTLSVLLDGPAKPPSGRALLLRAIARQQQRNYSQAFEDLEAFLKSDAAKGDAKSQALYVRGLCEVGVGRTADAITTFRSLLAENPKYPEADKVLFELAWALTNDGQQQQATETFARLARAFPDSSLAAESLYRVGEFEYHEKKDYPGAVAAYSDALKRAGKTELGEQAAHKLGWAYFQQDDYPAAQRTFAVQLADYSQGKLAPDAQFMEAESLFKQNRFADAAPLYQKARGAKLSSPEFDLLARLHAAECASQTKQWNDALALLDECASNYPESPYLPEVRFEQGWAKQNLGKTAEALKLYETVADQSQQVIGARARFMLAEVYLSQHNPTEALRHYFKVAYGYGYPQSPAAYHKWQADATYMAAFCCAATDKREQAKRLFAEVIEHYPDSDKAPLAKQKLAELAK